MIQSGFVAAGVTRRIVGCKTRVSLNFLACPPRLPDRVPCRADAAKGMKAKIIVTPKKAVVDPQGKTVQSALEHIGFSGIGAVHVGKYLEIELPDGDAEGWRKKIDDACHRFLSNPVIEDYQFHIE